MSADTAVAQLVLRERQARDRGWWHRMATCFDPTAPVFLSWMDGTATAFVEGSRAMFDSGLRPVHRLASPVVEVAEDRAVVEVGASIAVTVPIDGVEGNLVSFSRLLYQVQRQEDGWRLASLTAVYEDDTLTPSMPGTTLAIDADVIGRLRRSYRFLGYHQHLRGLPMRNDLYGDDQPDRVDALYQHAAEFVRRSREMYANGTRPSHRLAPPVVHVDGNRAVAEVPAEISAVHDFGGVEAYIVAYTRLLYRLESRADTWKITQLDCIYEHDTLVPVRYGATIELDPDILARFRPSHRYLGYHLHESGLPVRDDLFGDDRPDQLNALYDETFTWLKHRR